MMRILFANGTDSKKKKHRPATDRLFACTVTGVAIIENMEDIDKDMRPVFDLNLLDACLIPVEPVEASTDLLSPLRINCKLPTFESRASDSVVPDTKREKVSTKHKEKLRAKRLEAMQGSGYIVFDDAFLERYPNSRIARVNQQYATTYPLASPPPRVVKSGTAKRCKRARHFVRAAEQEHRPCFRRCPSEVFYGRSQYLDPVAEGVALTSSFGLKSAAEIPKVPSKPNVIKRICKSLSGNSLEREEGRDPGGCSNAEESDGSVHREVTIPLRMASVMIQA